MFNILAAVPISLSLLKLTSAVSTNDVQRLGAQAVNLWKLDKLAQSNSNSRAVLSTRDEIEDEFPAQWFTQPLDHFSNSSETFKQRYWINTRHYTPGAGGPVFVLDGGETSGEDRIPFLDTGIMEILAKATGGIGIVLEHRYYGKSIPVANFSTDSLRWLNNDQSAADSANFLANVKFTGIDEDLTAPGTPWIYYGGSYAGARAAHMRVLYPDLVYGAIASSGVTHAALSNWEYMEVIRLAANQSCSSDLQHSIETIDDLLTHNASATQIKGVFGLAELEHVEDFTAVLTYPLGSWQSKNWDPAVGSTAFDKFCDAILKLPNGTSTNLNELPYGDEKRLVNVTDSLSLDFSLVNYANYINKSYVSTCSSSIEECFGTFNDTMYQGTGLDEDWRLWIFQVCTEWGYFTTAPPDPKHPRIISRTQTLEYLSQICRQAYPPGEFFTVPSQPNVTAVNVLGDFGIAADRLAIIDGSVDPWMPDTPHSWYAEDRNDTILRPFKLIPGGVHHWDENGLKNMSAEPPEILKIHGEMIAFVLEWLKDWQAPNVTKSDALTRRVLF